MTVLTAYPVAYQVLRPQEHHRTNSPNQDTWTVFYFNHAQGNLSLKNYLSLEHARKERGDNLIILGACYGHIRAILRDHTGKIKDIINTLVERVPDSDVTNKPKSAERKRQLFVFPSPSDTGPKLRTEEGINFLDAYAKDVSRKSK